MKTRTKALSLVSSALLAASLAACGTANQSTGSGNSGTVTVGLIVPLTGSLAESGQDMENGAKIAVQQINKAGGINGKDLKLDVKDDGSVAQKATQAAKDLVQSGHKILVGGLSSIECGAIKSVAVPLKAVYVATTCVDPSVTGLPGKPGTPGIFRTATSNTDQLPYVSDQAKIINGVVSGITSWDYFGFDYSFGHTQAETFKNNLAAQVPGVTLANTVFAPVDSQNFRPYVSQLASEMAGNPNGRALFLGTYGGGTASFFQQAASFDFLPKYKMVFTTGDIWSVLLSLKGSFSNLWDWYNYMWAAFDNPTNVAFVKEYKAAHDRMPGGQSSETFNGVAAVAAAMKKAKSADSDAVSKALAGITFKSTQGNMTIDKTTHQADTSIVMANLEPDSSWPDGIKVLQTVIIHPDGTTEKGSTTLNLK